MLCLKKIMWAIMITVFKNCQVKDISLGLRGGKNTGPDFVMISCIFMTPINILPDRIISEAVYICA